MKKSLSKKSNDKGYRKMIRHVTDRVKKLSDIICNNPEVIVFIAGSNGESNLGKGIAKEQWELEGYTTKQYNNFIRHMDHLLHGLKHKFPHNVHFGRINGKAASSTKIMVWGANAKNYNLPTNSRIPGNGQARAVDIQRPGVFGIVTTPIGGTSF